MAKNQTKEMVEERLAKTWTKGEVITAEALNTLEAKAENALPKTQAATTEALGAVKQAALVPEASGAQVTKEEFKALLDALKAAGIMASA